jgi:hypothetical protein
MNTAFTTISDNEQRSMLVNNYQSMIMASERWISVDGISNKFLKQAGEWLEMFNEHVKLDHYPTCPACGSDYYIRYTDYRGNKLQQCRNCQAIFGYYENINDSYQIVKGTWSDMDFNEDTNYFDFTGIDHKTNKEIRRHGYYDSLSGNIIQVG